MKKLILSIFFTFAFLVQFSQRLVKEELFAKEMNENIKCHVWLPDGWDATKKYPVIYMCEILSISDAVSKQLAHTAFFYSGGGMSVIPKTIIVSIDLKNGDELGYSYGTGDINNKGKKFLKSVREDVIPLIENKYGASRVFRCYFGHSMSASYANYLFLHQEEIFNAYILLSPEQIAPQQPPFEITGGLIQYYTNKYTTYYLAYAGKDLERRKAYGKEINEKLKQLDPNFFEMGFDSFPRATHVSILPQAIPDALEFIYKSYSSYLNVDSVGNPLEYFRKTQATLDKLYGLPLEKNNNNAAFFMQLAETSEDRKALEYFADYFITAKTTGLDYLNFSYQFLNLGMKEKAEALLKKSIAISKKAEQQKHNAQNKLTMFMAYRSLAFNIYKEDSLKAWPILLEGLKETGDINMNYHLGRWAVENRIHLKEGIGYMLTYINSDHDGLWNSVKDQAYYYLGQGYLLLHDKVKARTYLEKALELNPANEKAKEAIKKL